MTAPLPEDDPLKIGTEIGCGCLIALAAMFLLFIGAIIAGQLSK